MTDVQNRLFELSDREYAHFQAKLTPSVDPSTMIGVRLPQLRNLARTFAHDPGCDEFLNSLPHKYYDENLLHSILITGIKDYNECLERVRQFLPYIDNWAVCDTLRPKAFGKNRDRLITEIMVWTQSEKTYECRFGLDMLMTFFLDDAFRPRYLEIAAGVESDEYYVRMMVAWFFATALAKQWNATVPYIKNHRLDDWTHRKTIQKAIESYRITEEQKAYLRSLR